MAKAASTRQRDVLLRLLLPLFHSLFLFLVASLLESERRLEVCAQAQRGANYLWAQKKQLIANSVRARVLSFKRWCSRTERAALYQRSSKRGR
jgi:hypothetical protein